MTEEPKKVELPDGMVLENVPEGLDTAIADLVSAFYAMKAYNGGYGVIKIYFKAAFSPYVDVEMRNFHKEEKGHIRRAEQAG
jgi:hypothetical protein